MNDRLFHKVRRLIWNASPGILHDGRGWQPWRRETSTLDGIRFIYCSRRLTSLQIWRIVVGWETRKYSRANPSFKNKSWKPINEVRDAE